MKRILSILCCVLILGAMRLSAQTVEITIDNIKYSCTGITAKVSGYGMEPVGALVIPNEVTTDGKTYTVTSIGNQAFFNCWKLTSIGLPASLTSIGNEAFGLCSGLASIELPALLTSIGNQAFVNCSGLTSIELPALLTSIGNDAFSYCWRLTSVTSLRTTPIAISSNVFEDVSSKILFIPEGEEALSAYQSADVWKDFGTIHQGKPIDLVINGIKYLCYENEAKVMGSETEPTGVLAIPSEVTTDGKTYTVTSIKNNAFSGCRGLTSIELPASLTAIGEGAFYGCSKLTLVTNLRTTPIVISSNVFDNASSKALSIPEGGEALSAYQSAAVWKDFGMIVQGKPIDLVINGIKYLCYENEAKVIGYETKPTGVLTIPSEVTTDGTYTVTSIGNDAFRDCWGLTSIKLPASLISIGERAFFSCLGLTSIKLPALLTSIGDFAFRDCRGLTLIELPASLISIENGVFSGCSGLTSIELPASLTSIENGVFSGCSGLTSIELPASLASIGGWAFELCSGLTSIELPASLISIENGVFSGCSGLTSIELPASLTSIGEGAFYGCSKLTLVTSLRTTPIAISSNVFDNVSSKMLFIPEGGEALVAYQNADVWKDFEAIVQGKPIAVQVINAIKYLCYENEAKVMGSETMPTGVLTIPGEVTTDGMIYTVTSIGNGAFYGCSGLTSIDLPASLTSIGNYAFERCSGLTSIKLPASLTSIENGVFSGCSGLTSIDLPASLTSIGNGAFFSCSELTSIELPASLTSIGNSAFSGCSGLTSIELPASLTSIENSAFSYCDGLTSIELPASLTSIENGVFSGCWGLTSIKLPASLISIGERAFSSCWGLTSIELPASLTLIGNSAFTNCRGLTSIELPASLTSIGNQAFSGCSELTSIELPASLTAIENYAFVRCFKLTLVTSLRTTPIAISSNVFDNVFSKILFIPKGEEILSAYQSADIWKDFEAIVQGKPIASVINGLKYLCYENEAKVMGSETEPTGVLAIPSEVTTDGNTYTVTSIGNDAFSNCSGLTSIELPASLTSIGNDAFSDCSGLTSIELPASLTAIGDYAFYRCSKLTLVTSLRITPIAISSDVFGFNEYSKTLFIPEGEEALSAYRSAAVWRNFGTINQGKPIAVTVINGIKYSCSDTTAEVIGYETKPTGVLAIPREVTTGRKTYTVTSIGNEAFPNCSELTSIELPASLTSIGDYAFERCYRLTSIELPASLTSIGDYAFERCYELTSIELPASLTSIGNNAFRDCSGLTSIELPASLTSIGNYAFYGCSKLRLVTSLRTTPIAISSYVFDDVSLKTLYIPKGEEVLAAYQSTDVWKDFGTIHQGKVTVINGIKYLCNENEAKVIGYETKPTGVLAIPSEVTTDGNTYTVTSIGNDAFRDCFGLTSIKLPASLTSIGNNVFYYCSGLTSIELPASLTSIGNGAFELCSGLTSVELPASLTSIGDYAFYRCSKLISVISLRTTPIAISSNVFDNVSSKILYIPEEEEVLAAYQSADVWKDFGTIVQGKPIDLVINGIKYLCYESEAKVIGYETKPTGVLAIPSEVTTDGNTYTVTSIGNDAFRGCTGLTSIELPALLTSIGNYAFSYCSGLTSIELPALLTSIGNQAFYGCLVLTSIELPASLTLIGNSAFSYCDELTSIELPASLTSIGEWAFYDCPKLTSVISLRTTPIAISSNVFDDVSLKTLYIPEGGEALAAYRSADVWKSFGTIVQGKPIAVTVINGIKYSCSDTTAEVIGYETKPTGVLAIPREVTTGRKTYTVTSIGNEAFPNCSGLTSIELPASLTSIGDYAFYGCTGLTSIELPASLTSIGNYAFYDCSKLTDIIYWGITEPLIGIGIVSSEIELWLPNASSGFTASNWKASLIHYGSVPVSVSSLESEELRCYASQQEIVVTSSQNRPLTITNLYGVTIHSGKTIDGTTRVSVTQSGVYIVRVGLKSFKVAVQ